MYRPLLRRATASHIPQSTKIAQFKGSQRFVSTSTGRKSGGVRSALLRWGLAGAAVYYYNTSNAFADEPKYAVHSQPALSRESENYATIDAIAEQRRAQARTSSPANISASPNIALEPQIAESPEALEEEASQQGAFNEETGEINWDCPCLGGMSEGPCGEQFKAAFSCFIFSKEDPKGVDCIDHFKTMQNCFREHPDVYGAELDDDEDTATPSDDDTGSTGLGAAVTQAQESIHETTEKIADVVATSSAQVKDEISDVKQRSAQARDQVQRDHAEGARGDHGVDVVPRAWHDSSDDSQK